MQSKRLGRWHVNRQRSRSYQKVFDHPDISRMRKFPWLDTLVPDVKKGDNSLVQHAITVETNLLTPSEIMVKDPKYVAKGI